MRTEAKSLLRGRVLRGLVLASGLLLGLSMSARAQEQVLIDVGASWKYFKGTVAPPAAWNTLGFADAGPEWLTGATGIGYSDGDDATELTDMQMTATNAGYMAFFARHQFTVASLASISSLTLELDYDDGFVAYLNGTEVARSGLGVAGSAVAFNQGAASHEAGTKEFFDIPIASLKQDANVLAIELHNTAITSSDASLIPRLLANAVTPPTNLACSLLETTVNLSWTDHGTYDSIRVERNGAVIATLAGTEKTYSDTSPSRLDNRYRVVGESGGQDLVSNVCQINCTASTLTCTLSLEGGVTKGHLSWTNVPDVTSVQIIREGLLRATLTGGEMTYTDANVEDIMPEFDTDYTVILTTGTGDTCTMACLMSLCPQITGAAQGGIVVLTISNVVKAWTHFEISRNGTILDAAVPSTETTWADTTVVLNVGDSYDYVLHPVAVPGGELPPPGTVCDALFTLAYAPELGSYNAPAGGWDYVIDFNGPGDVQYNATVGQPGNLDGRWIRSIDRDLWNGKGPDDVPGPAPDGPAPGGVDVVTRPGLRACGGDTSVLRVLDPGNTGAAIGTAFPAPFVPPSNSRILLGLDLGVTDHNVLKSGITFSARLRLSPDAPAYMNPNPASGDGEAIHNGFGMVGVYYKQTAALPAEGNSAGATFSLNSGANSGNLEFSSPGQDVEAIGAMNFVAVWMTVIGGALPDTYDVKIYLNGALTTSTQIGGTGITLANGTTDFGPTVTNFLAIGSNDTAQDAMIEIDFVAYKQGVHAPTSTPCGGEPPNAPQSLVATPRDSKVDLEWQAPAAGLVPQTYAVFRDGTRIATLPANRTTYSDGGRTNGTEYCYRVKSIRGLLESADSDPACATPTGVVGAPVFHRGDADDNGKLELTDAVRILGFLYLGKPAPTCFDAADADDNGKLELTDAVRILGFLYLGKPAPADPGPPPAACSVDPTPNDAGTDLGCVQYTCL